MANKPRNANPVHIDQSSGCWIWDGPLDCYGHPIASGGYFRAAPIEGIVPGRMYRVQHIAFQIANGYKARNIGTVCRNRQCINHAHLYDRDKGKAQKDLATIVSTLTARITELELTQSNLKMMNDPVALEYLPAIEKELGEKRELLKKVEGGDKKE